MKRLILFACLLLASCAGQAAFAQSAATRIFLTNTASCSWTVPADWNPNGAIIEAVGAGASGDLPFSGRAGGGGAYAAKTTGLNFAPGATIACNISTRQGGLGTPVDTWFNSTSFLLAKTAYQNGGGAASSSIGDVKFDGGSTGGYTGAGAGGPHGAGGGPSAGLSGVGDAGNTAGVNDTGSTPGNNGTQWDATHGIGSGGAGGPGGCGGGGQYGGGGGLWTGNGGCNGAQGIIVITYYPRRQVSSSVF